MAELAAAAAGPVIKMVVKKLASGLWRELGLMRSVHTDIEELQRQLSRIQNVLDDAEKKSMTNPTLQGWLRTLRDAALDLEDAMEEFEAETLRRRMERHDEMVGKVRDFFSSNNLIAFRRKMAGKMKEIRKRFDKIEIEMIKFHLAGGSTSERTLDRETFSSVIESEIYGRDDDKKEVMELLTNRNNDEDLFVLPIVGLGGVGKTTLAQLVYNDGRIKERFDLQIWVYVSENFLVEKIVRAIIECVTKKKCDLSNLQAMQTKLQEELSGKAFLLVLDDVWDPSEEEWDKLKTLLRVGKRGKLIVTTRNDRDARIMGTMTTKKLQLLQFDDCWTLFKQRAFRFEREEDNPELVEIGRGIIKKCGGLPLAAKALGSLMNSKIGKAEWLAVKNNEIWKLSDDNNGILPALKLSYDHLPSHLKRCFTYCAMFPKDHKFQIEGLIQLWMAEGLIDTSDTSQNAEDIGKQYFNNLLWRSFFQDVRMDKYNNPRTCQMHDLVHDLACSITKDEALAMEGGTKGISHECRYLSVVCSNMSSTALTTIYEAKKLRSLLLLAEPYHNIADGDEFFFNITKNFTQIRALDLSWSRIPKLSERTSRLKHLRFLDLSYNHIATLPISITRLYNLQTLKLQGCGQLQELPECISNLSNLRHIDISCCTEIAALPTSITRLYNLQTLNLRRCFELKEIPEGISNLSNLRHIDISWCTEITALPTSITRLYNLQTLNLQECYKLQELPEGISNLDNLRHIDMSGCTRIATLPNSITRLYNLQTLNLQRCSNLQELPEGISNLSNLRHIHLSECDKLSCMRRHLGRLSNLETLSMFIVARENGRTITELQHLNSIHGRLEIKNLHIVKDANEAMQANLGAKTRLNCLDLRWNKGSDDAQEPSPTEVEVAAGVFERLQPHHNLKELVIYYDIGTILPNWISSSLPNLVTLRLESLKRCEHLPSLGRLPLLRHLSMAEMHAVKIIGDEFYGDDDGSVFPSLEELRLRDMPNLEVWHTEPTTAGRERACFPRLSKLWIELCPKVMVQPCIPCSAEDLSITSSNEMLLSAGSLAGLSKLKMLYIGGCGVSSTSSSSGWWNGLQNLTALEELRIRECDELPCLPEGIMYVPSLHFLDLLGNSNLRSLEEGGRKQQQPTPFFPALRTLFICRLRRLAMLPDGMGRLTTLQNLSISECPQLATLPADLQHLTSLQHLLIWDCPQLARRCKREIGEDWHKIAHIPHVDIQPREDGEETSEPSTFAMKFLDQFGCARCMGHNRGANSSI